MKLRDILSKRRLLNASLQNIGVTLKDGLFFSFDVSICGQDDDDDEDKPMSDNETRSNRKSFRAKMRNKTSR